MIQNEASIEIAQPVSTVFAFVTDTSKAPSWLEACVELKPTSSGALATGTRMHYVHRQGGQRGEMDGVVTACELDRRFALKFEDATFVVEIDLRFARTGHGTSVTHEVAITPKKALGKLMTPLIRAGNKKQVAQNLARLKALLEPAR